LRIAQDTTLADLQAQIKLLQAKLSATQPIKTQMLPPAADDNKIQIQMQFQMQIQLPTDPSNKQSYISIIGCLFVEKSCS
jgi:hypothetical protein